MPKGQRTFTKEFKLEAVRLARTSGKSISQVAGDLGIGDSTLHHWGQQLAEQGEQAFPGSRHQTAEARRDSSETLVLVVKLCYRDLLLRSTGAQRLLIKREKGGVENIQLYHADSYLREMGATVTLVDGAWVALDQMVFFAQSGGLSAAHGTLVWADAQTRVSDARRKGNVLYHHVEGSIPPEGTRVHGLLDWEGRSALMRAHITMDFVTEVEQRITAEVGAEREVHIRFLPRAHAFSIPDLIRTRVNLLPTGIEVVRICEHVGQDLQADGGTHVARTGEVGSEDMRARDVPTSGCAWPSRGHGQAAEGSAANTLPCEEAKKGEDCALG